MTRDFLKSDLPELLPPFEPDACEHSAIPAHIRGRVGVLAQCYWFGLANEVRPWLREIVRWMEVRNPPDFCHWSRNRTGYRARHGAHLSWWLSLGLGRWLVDDSQTSEDFARGTCIEWSGWENATPEEATRDRSDRQEYLGLRLAACLAADQPSLGVRFYEAARVRPPYNFGRPILEYGRWASSYLAQGNQRDREFVERGGEMLRQSFLPFLYPAGNWFESAIWLKAIFFDSGITKTAEETIFRAYDCMPGVPRPAFVPRAP